MSGGTGNDDDDGHKVSRAHVEPHPGTTPERTVTWPVKDGDALIGTVRLSKGVHECVLPDGTVIETFKNLNFAVEFLHQRGQSIPPEEQTARLKTDVGGLSRQSPSVWMYCLPDYAKRHGVAEEKLQEMIKAEIEVNEKKAREEQQKSRRRSAGARSAKRRRPAKRRRRRGRSAKRQSAGTAEPAGTNAIGLRRSVEIVSANVRSIGSSQLSSSNRWPSTTRG